MDVTRDRGTLITLSLLDLVKATQYLKTLGALRTQGKTYDVFKTNENPETLWKIIIPDALNYLKLLNFCKQLIYFIQLWSEDYLNSTVLCFTFSCFITGNRSIFSPSCCC